MRQGGEWKGGGGGWMKQVTCIVKKVTLFPKFLPSIAYGANSGIMFYIVFSVFLPYYVYEIWTIARDQTLYF